MEEVVQKPKRVMSEEALAKLAIAREKANAKRKELAAQRHEEKENIVQEKMEVAKAERAAKVEMSAQKEAKKRLAASEPSVVAAPVTSTKKRRESIVIERSESDSSEDDVRDARVYFVKKHKHASPPPAVPVRANTPDPLHGVYSSMFGGSTNYL